MSNFLISDFVNIINVSSRGHLKSVYVPYTKLIFQLLDILYKNGIIYNFKFNTINNKILVFLKYYQNRHHSFHSELVSKPSKRIFLPLKSLSLDFNKNSFSCFYIILLKRVY